MSSKLSEAMDHIHDAYIMDAVNTYRVPEAPAPRGQSWRSLVVAAMVLLVIGVMMIPVFNALDTSGGSEPPVMQSPTTIVPTISPDAPTTAPSDVPTTAPTSGSTTTQPTTAPTSGSTTAPTGTTAVPTGSSTTSTTTGRPSLSVTLKTDKTVYDANENITFTITGNGASSTLIIYHALQNREYRYNFTGSSYVLSFYGSGEYQAYVRTTNGNTTLTSATIYFTIKDLCYDGHTFKNGFCIYCLAVAPACANGHDYLNGFCIKCAAADPDYDPCADGHTYENGWCIYCAAPDPAGVRPTFAVIAADAFSYKQGDKVKLHMYCDGTANNLVISKPNGSVETIQNVGSDYAYAPTMIGQYQAYVITLNNGNRFESEKVTFRVVDPNSAILPSNQQHPCANGHFLEDGTCAKCGSLVYVVYPCSDGHSYENGSCTQCGMVACTTNHTLVQGKHRCTQCNTHVFCLNGVHRVENGVCTLCGKTKPADCTDGHIYCDYVCVRCWSPDPATCRQNSHDFYAENGLDYHYCIRCGVSTSCAYDISHDYENGICKYCGNFEDRDEDCKLIVNGEDITAGNYVKINIRNSNASIPLTAVLTELGIPWEWESETVLRFGSGDYEQTLDTSNNIQFNWLGPSRTPGIVRKVVDGEVIVDIQSLWTNLLNKMGISCEMDCAAKTIRIG